MYCNSTFISHATEGIYTGSIVFWMKLDREMILIQVGKWLT